MSKNTVNKVIDIAMAEIGYLEKKNGNSLYEKTANAGSANYTKYGKEMHEVYPTVMDYPAYWCDAFVDWCFYKAYGVATAKSLIGGDFDDYTIASANMYKKHNAYYKIDPKVGDQIFFNNGKRICHTGIVYKVDNLKVYTIEGNTSSKSGVVANGGAVEFKDYKLNYDRIDGYGRPKYDIEDAVNIPTVNTSTVIKNIVKTNLNIRSKASAVSSKVGMYTTGQEIQVLDVSGYWLKTNLGWVSGKYVESKSAVVNANVLNVRSKPNTSGAVVASIVKNTLVTVYTESNGWYLTNKGGWVSGKYVAIK